MTRSLSRELLDILACPKCKGKVELRDGDQLVCRECRLVYEIRQGIPVMLVDEARPLDENRKGT